jgi:hypothetical protein
LLTPAPDVVARQLGESAVLIDLTTNRIYTLNRTAARLWALLGHGAMVSSLLATLRAEFDAPADRIQHEVGDLVRELLAEGLVLDA